MKNKLSVTLILVFLLSATFIFAQKKEERNNPKIRATDSHSKKKADEDKEPLVRWHYGFNVGVYLANRYNANYYNGSEDNVNKLSYVMKNQYWVNEIRQLLNLSSTDSIYYKKDDLPSKMHYNTTMTAGVFLRYSLTRRLDFFLDANYAKLKADDVVTMTKSHDTTTLQLYYKLPIPIHGEEERINFDLGAHYAFPVYKNKMNLFLEGGLNLNYTKVLKSFIYFVSKEYSIINIYGDQNYVPNSNTQEFPVTQGGIGYGVFGGGGIGFTFVPQFGMELGSNVRYVSVNMEGYTAFKPSLDIYLRFTFGSYKSSEDE